MIGSGFPYTEFLPQEGQARGVQIDINPGMLSLRYPMEVELVGDSAETLRALLPLLEPKRDRAWRQEIEASVRDWREEASTTRPAARRSGQPATPLPRAVAAAPRRLRPDCRFRHLNRLVRTRSRHPGRDARLRLGDPGHDGLRHPLRHRRQVRLSGTRGAGADRGRRHADEWHDGAGDDCQVLAGVVRSPADRARPQQPRPWLRHLGATRHGGRAPLRSLPGSARRPLRPLRRVARADRDRGRPAGGYRPCLGPGADQ